MNSVRFIYEFIWIFYMYDFVLSTIFSKNLAASSPKRRTLFHTRTHTHNLITYFIERKIYCQVNDWVRRSMYCKFISILAHLIMRFNCNIFEVLFKFLWKFANVVKWKHVFRPVTDFIRFNNEKSIPKLDVIHQAIMCVVTRQQVLFILIFLCVLSLLLLKSFVLISFPIWYVLICIVCWLLTYTDCMKLNAGYHYFIAHRIR